MESVVIFTALLAELNSGVLVADEVKMETEERRNDQCKHACQYVRSHNEIGILVVETLRITHGSAQNWVGGADNKPSCTGTVEKHAQEELVVVESDAVGDPRAVMVHLENASIALRTMMASIRLCLVAPLANPNTAELLLLYRDLELHS